MFKLKLKKSFLSNEVYKAVIALVSANLFTTVVSIAGSFVQGIFVTAEELGFFKQFGIISGYLFFLHLGTFHAIERLYPYYKGKGDHNNAVRVVEIANSWIISVCLLITAVLLALAISAIVKGDWKTCICWLVQIATIWGSLYGGFLAATYRSGKEFQSMAKASYLNPFLSLITIPLYWIQPFVTMALRSCTNVATTIRLHLKRPVRVKFRFNFKELLSLISEGLPLFSASYITSTGLDAIRASIIVAILSLTDLGLWSFSYQILLIVLMLPTAIIGVYSPRVIERFASTNNIKETLQIAKQPIKIGLLISLAIVPLGMVLIYFFMPLILPNYSGTTMLIVVLLLAVPLKLTDIYSSVLIAARKRVQLNVIALLGASTQIIGAVVGVFCGLGVLSFALSFLLGYVVRAASYMWVIGKLSIADSVTV